MLTRQAIERERRCMQLEGAGMDAFAALDMALKLIEIAEAWQRYQRKDLSQEEFEGVVAARCE